MIKIIALTIVVLFFIVIAVWYASKRSKTGAVIPEGFVDIKQAIPDIIIDARYATKNNFTGRPLYGYEGNCLWGEKEMVAELKKAHAEVSSRGLNFKVWDAYRPLGAEWQMIDWAIRTNQRHLIGQYVPGKVDPLSTVGHTSGNMIDLTLTDANGRELPMGTDLDEFTPKAHTENADGEALENRQVLVRTLAAYGFKNYPNEWWHFKYDKKPHEALNVPISCRRHCK